MDMQFQGKPLKDDVIHELAHNTHRSVEEVKMVYERQMAVLEAGAKITTFLPVFAKRRAHEELARPH